jgi:hypothetical protein
VGLERGLEVLARVDGAWSATIQIVEQCISRRTGTRQTEKKIVPEKFRNITKIGSTDGKGSTQIEANEKN